MRVLPHRLVHEGEETRRRIVAPHAHVVREADGHAVQRPDGAGPRKLGVEAACSGQRVVRVQLDQAVCRLLRDGRGLAVRRGRRDGGEAARGQLVAQLRRRPHDARALRRVQDLVRGIRRVGEGDMPLGREARLALGQDLVNASLGGCACHDCLAS